MEKISFEKLIADFVARQYITPAELAKQVRSIATRYSVTHLGLFESAELNGMPTLRIAGIGPNSTIKSIPDNVVSLDHTSMRYSLIAVVTGKEVADKAKLAMPSLKVNSYVTGGEVKDCEPFIRYFDPWADQLRKVKLKVNTWVGTSAIGAKHVYASLEPEDDYVWNWKEAAWCKPWDMAKELELATPRMSWLYLSKFEPKLTRWVKSTVKKYFPPDKFYLVDDGGVEVNLKTWSYSKDGNDDADR